MPVYHQTGWYDRLIGAIDHYTAMVAQGRTEHARRHQKLIIGPWTHSSGGTRQQGDRDFGPEAEVHVADLMTPWFDYWLKGHATGVMDEPPVRYFVMGANRWETATQWPPASVQPTPFYCHAETAANRFGGGGHLDRERPGAEPPDRFVYDPRDPVMSVLPPGAQDAPGDHRVLFDRQDVLYYTSTPLTTPLKIVGPVEARLFIASSAPDTDFTAILLDVAPGDSRWSTGLCPEPMQWYPALSLPPRRGPAGAAAAGGDRGDHYSLDAGGARFPPRPSDCGGDIVEQLSALRPQSQYRPRLLERCRAARGRPNRLPR